MEKVKNPKFKYQKRPQSVKVLLHFQKDDDIRLENPSLLSKKEWNKKFNLEKLYQYFSQRVNVNFHITDHKFEHLILPKKILDLKNKKFNYKTESKEIYDKNLFDVKHRISHNELTPKRKKKKVYLNEENINFKTSWNKNSILENYEKKELENKQLKFSQLNSRNYFNTHLSLKTKHKNLITSFKEDERLLNKIKQDTEIEREKIEEKVIKNNPGINKYPEKINAMVYKEMKDIYKQKLKHLKDKNKNDNIITKTNDNHYSDKELTNKVYYIDSFLNNNNDKIYNFNYEIEYLEPLMTKKKEIKKLENEEKMNLKKKEEKEKKLKELTKYAKTKLNQLNLEDEEDNKSPLIYSKYPITNGILKRIKENPHFYHPVYDPKKNIEEIEKENKEINEKNLFLNAYNNIASSYVNNLEKEKKIYNEKYTEEFKHIGAYTLFINEKKKEFHAWSCCMNEDRNSKGCVKKKIKNFRWNYY